MGELHQDATTGAFHLQDCRGAIVDDVSVRQRELAEHVFEQGNGVGPA